MTPYLAPSCRAGKYTQLSFYPSAMNYRDRLKSMQAGPRQGQAEQVSNSRNKLLATTYKPFSRCLYAQKCVVQTCQRIKIQSQVVSQAKTQTQVYAIELGPWILLRSSVILLAKSEVVLVSYQPMSWRSTALRNYSGAERNM